jgi:hypothetical protein
MKNYKIYFFLVGSVITFSISSCVRSIEKVHSADLRKLDPKLQGVRKCFDNDAVNDVYTWENKRKPELIQYYENYIFGKRPVFSPKRVYASWSAPQPWSNSTSRPSGVRATSAAA